MKVASSYLDLDSLDTSAIATMLREAALAQLTRLLAGAPPRDLDPFLDSCAAGLAERGRYTLSQAEFKSLMERAVRTTAAQNKVNEQLMDYMQVQLAGNPPYRFPDVLWGVIEQWAWQEPAFLHQVDAEFRRYSSRNYLMVPGGAVRVTLAPQSFWLLLALAHSAVASQSRLARFGRMVRRQLRAWWRGLGSAASRRGVDGMQPPAGASAERMAEASERLARWAERRVMSNGWADFWDQWLVSRARTRWSKPFENLGAEMKRELLHLPYVMREQPAPPNTSYQAGAPNPTQPVRLAPEEGSRLAAATWLVREPLWLRNQVAANEDGLNERSAR